MAKKEWKGVIRVPPAWMPYAPMPDHQAAPSVATSRKATDEDMLHFARLVEAKRIRNSAIRNGKNSG